MVGVCKIEIPESEAELKELLRDQKTASSKERVHLSAPSQVEEGASSAQYWATTTADDNFKETFATRLALMRLVNRATHVRYWCEDESR
ncbi:hypothetical protein [Leptothermofonsia sp. ETS-13]|uniref:hypothetical protein n=1 Tax=Leptothermofonsia sp. ETS-13 TaxID=3035696 RepID=UPI003B9E79B5